MQFFFLFANLLTGFGKLLFCFVNVLTLLEKNVSLNCKKVDL